MRSIKMIALGACLLMVSACVSGPVIRPDFCKDQRSLIYDVADSLKVDPKTIDAVLVISDIVALKNKPEGRETALKVINELEAMLTTNPLTYRVFINKAMEWLKVINTQVGSTVVITSTFVVFLDKDIPISNCDRQLFLIHLRNQKNAINQAFGS